MKKTALVAILLLSLLVPILPVNAAGGEMQTPIFGGIDFALDDTDTEYNVLSGGTGWMATESTRINVIPSAGVIKDLRIRLNGAPGADKSYVFTLRLNGAPTTLTATVTGDTAVTANDTSHDVTVAAGDYVSLECNPDGTPTVRDAYWSTMFEATVAGESIMLGSSTSVQDDQARFTTPMASVESWDDTENDRRTVMPTAGTIKNLYVRLNADPGTDPDAYRFTLRKGGASQTLTCTITADDVTGSDTTHSVAVAAGDIITFMVEPLNGPAVEPATAGWGFTFVPSLVGESVVLGCVDRALDQNLDDYMYVVGYGAPDTIESGYYSINQECIISKLYVLLSAAPGAGNSYTFTIRESGADTSVTTYVGVADTTGNSASDQDTIRNSEYITLESHPVSVPNAAALYWGFVLYSGDPEPTNDACDSDTVFNRNYDGWVNVTVSDYLITNLATVDIQVNTTNNYENFTLRWTQATNTFSELSDPDDICTLNTSRSTRVNIDENTDQICFCFTITGGTSGDCDVTVTTTDDDANTDIDTYNAEFEFSYYAWDTTIYDWIDSAFEQFVLFNYMAQITTFINGLTTYFADSLTHLLALTIQQFRVITNVYNFVVFWITELIGIALDFSVFYQSVVDGTSGWDTGIGDFWGVIEYDLWAPVVPLLLFIWWMESLAKRGAQTVGGELQVFINDMNTGISIVSYFVSMFSFVANTIIDRVYGLFDAIV